MEFESTSNHADMMMPRPKMNTVWIFATALLAGQVAFLTVQNRTLRTRLADATAVPLPEGALEIGDYLDPIRLVDETGASRFASFVGEQRSLVLFFSEECPACQRALPVWDELLPEYLSSREVQIVAIDLGHEDDGLLTQRAFPVFGIGADDRLSISEQIPRIPAAAWVGSDGVVDRVWFGVPQPEDVDELIQLLQSRQSG